MEPVVTYTQDTFRFAYPELEIECLFEHFTENARDGVTAELWLTTSRYPKPGLLYYGGISFKSATSHQAVLKNIRTRVEPNGFLSDVDFDAILTQTSALCVRKWRDGTPAVRLVDLAPDLSRQWLLYPYLQENAVTVLFGDGGTGKTTLGQAIGLTIASGIPILGREPSATGNVMYLDWETEAETHWEMLSALCSGVGIKLPDNIWYRRMHTSLPSGVGPVRREVALNNITLVIVDSIGLAGGDEPERAGPKIGIFNALRTLQGCTILALDHVAKGDKTTPYGSVYTRNIARVAWAVDKAQEEGEDRLDVALRMEKINRGKLAARHGYSFHYTADGDALAQIDIQRADIMEIPSFAAKAPLQTQIGHELRKGSLSIKDLAERLDAKEGSVKQALRRNKHAFVPVGEGMWGLVT